MKLVYTHDNKLLVENVRNILATNQVESVLRNEFVSSGLGELSGIDTWPEVWVQDDVYDKASRLVAELQTDDGGRPWVCSDCEESNESTFELCWQCQALRPPG